MIDEEALCGEDKTEETLSGEKIKRYGLKIKLFILDCVLQHPSLGHDIAREFESSLDYCDDDPRTIFENIEKSKFIKYSTLVFLVNGYCRCRFHVLRALLYCIRNNNCLRYKAKLIILNYTQRCHASTYEFGPVKEVRLNCGKYDNLIIFQNNVEHEADISQCYLIMLLMAQATPFKSIQQLLKHAVRPPKHEVVRSSTNADLYLYTINPALAIIVNNYYFTSPHTIREGSELDVIHLIRELKIARIPYILIEDCDRTELLKILEYIENKDFQPLKSFLFFLMSHGSSDNIIYTHDGQLNVNTDVVGRIQANKSLEDVEKLIVVNACRGIIDMEYADLDDLDQIKPTDGSLLKKNTMVLYGVPDQIQAPRFADAGCPLISSFCKHFRNIDHTDDIRVVSEQIDKDLKSIDYYYDLDNCSELVTNDPGNCHRIIQLPTNAVTMIELIESIVCEFPTFTPHEEEAKSAHKAGDDVAGDDVAGESKLRTLFHICGTLNEKKFPKIAFVNKYFAAELDND